MRNPDAETCAGSASAWCHDASRYLEAPQWGGETPSVERSLTLDYLRPTKLSEPVVMSSSRTRMRPITADACAA